MVFPFLSSFPLSLSLSLSLSFVLCQGMTMADLKTGLTSRIQELLTPETYEAMCEQISTAVTELIRELQSANCDVCYLHRVQYTPTSYTEQKK